MTKAPDHDYLYRMPVRISMKTNGFRVGHPVELRFSLVECAFAELWPADIDQPGDPGGGPGEIDFDNLELKISQQELGQLMDSSREATAQASLSRSWVRGSKAQFLNHRDSEIVR